MTLNDIKLNPFNPRSITGRRFEKLETYLDEYGDLSGVVYNTNPECKSLIGGHQRLRVFRKKKGKIIVLQRFDPPQKDGTTASGFIELPNEQRFVYREVLWTKEKADKATIIANGMFGEWDSERLSTHFHFEPHELEEMGVPAFVFGGSHEYEEDTFKPNYQPSFSKKNITEQDVQKTAVRLKDKFLDAANDQIEFLCPHCAEAFFVNRKDI